MNGTVSILDGSTFLVSSENGDIHAGPNQPEGLFFKDTRHLSLWKLTVNNVKMAVLSTDTIEYYFAQFYCVPPTGTIYQNPTLSVVRRRLVGEGFVEEVTVVNHSTEEQAIELDLRAGSDFADLFEIKDALSKKGEYYNERKDGRLVLGYKRGSFVRKTIISASVKPTELDEGRLLFRFTLRPKDSWALELQVRPVTGEVEYAPRFASSAGGNRLREDLAQWVNAAPTVTAFPDHIRQLYMRSLVDIAALRFRPETMPEHSIPAAGLPWFMAMFGR